MLIALQIGCCLLAVSNVYAQVESQEVGACQSPPTRSCILNLALNSLPQINTDEEWITGAVEVALALDAVNDEADALKLMEDAIRRTDNLPGNTTRATALSMIADTLIDIGTLDHGFIAIRAGENLASEINDDHKRFNLVGKFAATRAKAGDDVTALDIARNIPEFDDTIAAYKARTLQEIALAQAQLGKFDEAQQTLRSITMGLRYYASTARSDVGKAAVFDDERELASRLLNEAEAIARAQNHGYFVAGALRHIGEVYAAIGQDAKALTYFEDALEGARMAPSHQEQARALSRISTAMSDFGHYERAKHALTEAIAIAEAENNEGLRNWALYEIAGALAFAGDFQRASDLVDLIPETPFGGTQSIKSAAQRDAAWGLARHREYSIAVETANSIETPREKVQALSRIVRIMVDPDMTALPRYI